MRKHFQYLRYLLRHKFFVFVAGQRTGVSLWRLIIHDWSKFLPCEWFPYVNFFYGRKLDPVCDYIEMEERKEDFNAAWLHHQHANMHHHQSWVLRNDDGTTVALDMPDRFVREMVADWMGAGRAITGKWDVAAWYGKNRDKMLLSAWTRARVERLIDKVSKEPSEGGLWR